jgi:multiple sugar transport system substrate-binding protein
MTRFGRGPASRGQTRRGVFGLAAVLGAAGGGGVVAACAGSTSTGRAGAGQSTTKDRQPVTLRSWVATPGSDTYPATEAADAAIKQKYPHVTIVHEVRPPGDYIAAVIAAGAAGSLPDVIYAQGTQIQGFIIKGLVKPLDSYLAKDKEFDLKDFPPVALQLYARDGKQYAIPYDHGANLLWFNKDLFEKEGVKPPDPNWTMDDFLEAAKRLTKPNGEQWGMGTFLPSGGWQVQSYFKPWGGSLLNEEETEIQIDSKESIEALDYWVKARLTHKVGPMPGDWDGVQRGLLGLYLQGKTGTWNDGAWAYRSVRAAQPNFVADIADWPKGPKTRSTASMGSGYPTSKDTPHPDDAWLYLSEYLGKDTERSLMGQFIKTGLGIPVRLSLMPKWEASQYAPPSAKIAAPAMQYAVIGRPISPAKADLDKVFNDALTPVWEGKVAVADAAREIKRLGQPLVDANKKG